MVNQKLNEAALAQDYLKRLGENTSVLDRAVYVLELVAHSSVGLGEVLQDYAHQACGQLREIIRISQNSANGLHMPDDIDILKNIHLIMKSVKTVLDLTPAAMARNKADAIGEGKLSRAEVAQVADAFTHCADVARFFTAEGSAQALAALLGETGAAEPVMAPEPAVALSQTASHH